MLRKLLPLLLALSTCTIYAAPLVLTPQVLTGGPGETVGWGFEWTPDPNYYVTVSGALVDSESNPALGLFTDFISVTGGPTLGVIGPGAPWIESYDATARTGFGDYTIDPGALPGDSNFGQFLLLYVRYSGDPNSCGSCFVDSQFALVDFGVNVTEPVPEPASIVMAGLGAAVLFALKKRR
jgi:hypothetical protein